MSSTGTDIEKRSDGSYATPDEGNTQQQPDQQQPQGLYADEENGMQLIRRTTTQTSNEEDVISRILTGGSRKKDNTPLPKMGGGREYPPDLPDRDAWRVDFDGPDDPIFPHNWAIKRKITICVILGFATLCSAWGSAVYAPAAPFIMVEYGIGQVTATLGVSLYVLGFASGPVMWAPLSELYGRKPPLVVSMFGLTVFTFGVAVGKDIQTIMICRFFAGFLGAAPLVVVAAAFADLFDNTKRGIALSIFSGTVFTGPILAPVVGGFIANSYLGWRWTQYITGIMAGFATCLVVFFYQETYHPIILAGKAQELRRRTGNWGIYASQEAVELDLNDIVTKNLTRPVVMLVREPIILLITIYTAFIYGILYLCLEAYPIVFTENYGWSGGKANLPYLGLAVGQLCACVLIATVLEPRYVKAVQKNNGKPVPEARLPGMILGAIAFPIGIFWFTWTGNYAEHVHWAAPTVAGLFIGFGLLSIFLCAINYIVDAYLVFAASALAGNTFLRSACGAAFPLFAAAMFHNLGTNWAGTLIGCIAVVLLPVPILFYIYGKTIRGKSKYAFDL
jgi:DHA1 family multidrug resistance protein-like MFS transporter